MVCMLKRSNSCTSKGSKWKQKMKEGRNSVKNGCLTNLGRKRARALDWPKGQHVPLPPRGWHPLFRPWETDGRRALGHRPGEDPGSPPCTVQGPEDAARLSVQVMLSSRTWRQGPCSPGRTEPRPSRQPKSNCTGSKTHEHEMPHVCTGHCHLDGVSTRQGQSSSNHTVAGFSGWAEATVTSSPVF